MTENTTTTTEAKVPMSFKISQYIKNNPTAKPAEVAKAVGTTTGYVYVVASKMRKKASKKQKITKKVIAKRMELAKAEGEKKQQWKITHMSTSNTSAMPYEEEAKRIYELTNGRQRMHPVTGKMLMQAADKPKTDNVNHPAHYKVGGVETIDFIEAKGLGYNLGNVVKYITRAGHKNDLVEDLKKARWYLNREISKLDGAEQ
jgi:hypothetical protein